jgi:hypothetical protein
MSGNDILVRMMAAKPGCSCLKGGADPRGHDPACLYRVVQEGVAEIEGLRLEIRRLREKVAPRDLPGDADRWVRLMCYFGADGVWNSEDESADIGALALSGALKADLSDWRTSHGWTDAQAFSARALSLAHRIKVEQPDWKVVYIDRSKSRADIRNKDYFEYEIDL